MKAQSKQQRVNSLRFGGALSWSIHGGGRPSVDVTQNLYDKTRTTLPRDFASDSELPMGRDGCWLHEPRYKKMYVRHLYSKD